jgi:hypothetical protein
MSAVLVVSIIFSPYVMLRTVENPNPPLIQYERQFQIPRSGSSCGRLSATGNRNLPIIIPSRIVVASRVKGNLLLAIIVFGL